MNTLAFNDNPLLAPLILPFQNVVADPSMELLTAAKQWAIRDATVVQQLDSFEQITLSTSFGGECPWDFTIRGPEDICRSPSRLQVQGTTSVGSLYMNSVVLSFTATIDTFVLNYFPPWAMLLFHLLHIVKSLAVWLFKSKGFNDFAKLAYTMETLVNDAHTAETFEPKFQKALDDFKEKYQDLYAEEYKFVKVRQNRRILKAEKDAKEIIKRLHVALREGLRVKNTGATEAAREKNKAAKDENKGKVQAGNHAAV